MTKADIVTTLYETIGLSYRESSDIVNRVFELMKTALEDGEQIKISGFGTFTVKTKKVRRGRNPQTGESLDIAGRNVLLFKASAVLKNRMNQK